jgi:hypothetical protein
MSELGHAVRLLGLLRLTLAEFDEAAAAFLANVAEQEAFESEHGVADAALFEEGGRLSTVVHLRVETYAALARMLLARLGEEEPRLDIDRDLHVRFGSPERPWTASVWATSGDAGISPGDGSALSLRELHELLEGHIDAARRNSNPGCGVDEAGTQEK